MCCDMAATVIYTPTVFVSMQLTNIARDVIEDKKMNREYIKPDFENIQATLKLADLFYESSFTS